MGMYTEFIFGCTLSEHTPKICVDALDTVINGDKHPKYEEPKDWREQEYNKHFIERTTPEEEIREFIERYNLGKLFYCTSYYFGAPPVRRFYYDYIDNGYHISTRSNLKNYDNEIEKFLEYIKPYVEQGSGYPHQIYAYVQYEEAEFPTIYAMDGVYDINKLINKNR